MGEAIEGNAEESDDDPGMCANRELLTAADEFDGLEADFVAIAEDLVVKVTGGREAGESNVVACGHHRRPEKQCDQQGDGR